MGRTKKTPDWPIVAICYDFDKTLSPDDMQTYALFPTLGISAEKFWEESNGFAEQNGMDKILSYMRLIVRKAEGQSDTLSLVKNDFLQMGKDVQLFDGLDTWFTRINEYAASKELAVEHYIISAGLKEIIEGTSIFPFFKEVYASSFYYDKNDIPKWPKQVVNYTQKTQYLFRINKNCLDLSDEESINESILEDNRRVPFRNFIYIGDSITDIPAMKVVKKEKGHAIGVYNPKMQTPARACALFDEERINFFAPADYTEGSVLEAYVKKAIDQVKANEEIANVNTEQRSLTGYLDYVFGVVKYFENTIEEETDMDSLGEIKKDGDKFFKTAKKTIGKNYIGDCFVSADIFLIIDGLREKISSQIKDRSKELKKKKEKEDESSD